MFRRKFNPIHWFRRNAGNATEHAGRNGQDSRHESAPAAETRDEIERTYSRRMMPPFTGQLQVAEIGTARALSIDGIHWELQLRFTAEGGDPAAPSTDGDKRRNRYTAVASITPRGLVRQPLHPYFDTGAVTVAIDRLCALIERASLPYPAIDRFEYWLLDRSGDKPLALLHSCIDAEEIGAPLVRPAWQAMPAAQLPIDDAIEDVSGYVAPVNARLEGLIAERAGHNPRAAWFDRSETTATEFPACLISEDWEGEEQDRLCQLYIRRLAPRLLMLQGLTQTDRQRLEQACSENAPDVERFYSLYPEVLDQRLLQALRVEARLRRDCGPANS